jgi:tetratricopeptide (TPR) repeat protein
MNEIDGIAGSYVNIGVIYAYKNDYPRAIENYNKAIEMYTKINDIRGMANCYNNIGSFYSDQGKHNEAIKSYKKSLDLCEGDNYSKGISTAHNNLGLIYFIQGNYALAVNNYYASLKIKKQSKDQRGMALSYENIGNIYLEQGKYQLAKENFYKSLEIRKNLGDTRGLGTCYSLFGLSYYKEEKYDMAIAKYKKSLIYRLEVEDKNGTAVTYNHLGEVYIKVDSLNKAYKYLQKALKISKEINVPQDEMLAYVGLGHYYEETKQYDKAIAYYDRAVKLAKETGDLGPKMEAHNGLYQSYRSLNNFKLALYNHEDYYVLHDSTNKVESRKQIANLGAKFEVEQQKKEIELKNTKLKASAQENEKQKAQRNLILFILIGIAGGAVLLFRSVKQQKKANKIISLQKKEVEKAKEVVEKQKEEVELQKEEIEKQKEVVEEKNHEIMASINYSKKIQTAILPSYDQVKQNLPESFVFFRPKDVVSGDFYWFDKVADDIYFTAADCTGHGVPGAMVSVICANALTKAVKELCIKKPNEILDQVAVIVEDMFDAGDNVQDGMDLSFCRINKATNYIEYAGANNPLWIVREKNNDPGIEGYEVNLESTDGSINLYQISADPQPIGKYFAREPFTNHSLQLKKGDSIYMFSDGYQDQFGGPKGKKYKPRVFKKFLMSINNKPMIDQQKAVEEEFIRYKGSEEQVDDICVIGVKL